MTLSRRQFLHVALTSGVAAASFPMRANAQASQSTPPRSTPPRSTLPRSAADMLRPPTPSQYRRPPYLGTTFSPLQCYYMNLDPRQVFKSLMGLGLNRIRLGAYWHELEPKPGQMDFSQLDWLLEQCHQAKIEVVLAVGMKVPRWPEFHFPDWVKAQYETGAGSTALDLRSPLLAERSTQFVEKVVAHTRMAPAIKYWQVENEPFTRLEITGGRWLSPEFVGREVALVRAGARGDQKICLTNAIHLPTPKEGEDTPALKNSAALADAVGINVYTKVPAGPPGIYLEPSPAFWNTLKIWQQDLVLAKREPWIAEAQAEPWEPQQLVAMQKLDYPSAAPRRMTQLVTELSGIGYQTILLWGCEYWYWQRQQGRNLWWWSVEKLVESSLG
jgi:hypothetical protein